MVSVVVTAVVRVVVVVAAVVVVVAVTEVAISPKTKADFITSF